MEPMTCYFSLEKETKGAVRYQETNLEGTPLGRAAIGTIYLRKDILFTPYPRKLVVELKEAT